MRVLPSQPLEKAALVAALLVYTFGCYYAIGLWGDPSSAASLNAARTSLSMFAFVLALFTPGRFAYLPNQSWTNLGEIV